MPRPSRLLLLAPVLCVALAVPRVASASAPPGSVVVTGALQVNGGAPVADGKYSMWVKLWDAADAGANQLHAEAHIGVPVAQGHFTIVLGETGQAFPDGLFATQPAIWMGVSIEGEPELPRARLLPVPWAIHAGTADKLAKPLTGDLLVPGSVGANAVGFTYAGSSAKGGAAQGLECTGCIGLAHLQAGVLDAQNVAYAKGLTVMAALDALQAALATLQAVHDAIGVRTLAWHHRAPSIVWASPRRGAGTERGGSGVLPAFDRAGTAG